MKTESRWRRLGRWIVVAGGWSGMAVWSCAAVAEDRERAGSDPGVVELPPMTVTGEWGYWHRPLDAVGGAVDAVDRAKVTDAAGLVGAVPGGAVVRNGPLTGIPQLRGLWGDRVQVRVDGMQLTPACPNHMDPPLHYVSAESLAGLLVMAGITPVSQGGDSLGGTVLASTAASQFATNQGGRYLGEAFARARTGNAGLELGGRAGASSRRLAASYEGVWQTGEDYRFDGGRVRDTGYEIQHHRALLGWKADHGVLSLDAGLGATRDSGTPALPMDMVEDDSARLGVSYEGEAGGMVWEGRLYHHTIDHLMDNYSLRPAGPVRAFSPATSRDTGLRLEAGRSWDSHHARFGFEDYWNQFDAYQENAVSGARQDTLNDAWRDHAGWFAEWLARWGGHWSTLAGVRGDVVWSDAGAVEQWYPPATADRARFNAAERDVTEVNMDATVSGRWTPAAWGDLELAFARKCRAPSLLERYLWTPLSASAGQADGRTYLGNLELDSEVSWQTSLAFEWRGVPRLRVRATPFYNRVLDYIQGVPIARNDALGRPVLQFQNVEEAELYGVDVVARWDLSRHIGVSGLLSYVRGRNLEMDDNLYRIAPLRGQVNVDQRFGPWTSTVEVVVTAPQEEVASYNAEPSTPGYALLNLRGSVSPWRHADLEWGLENVFDEGYADHLGGINRVAGSDVPVGARLPGWGRSLYLGVRLRL